MKLNIIQMFMLWRLCKHFSQHLNIESIIKTLIYYSKIIRLEILCAYVNSGNYFYLFCCYFLHFFFHQFTWLCLTGTNNQQLIKLNEILKLLDVAIGYSHFQNTSKKASKIFTDPSRNDSNSMPSQEFFSW